PAPLQPTRPVAPRSVDLPPRPRALDHGPGPPTHRQPDRRHRSVALAVSEAPPLDLEVGAFSDRPPWLVDPDARPWRRSVPTLRSRTRRAVPRLLRPGRVPPIGRLVRVVTRFGWALAGWHLVERRSGDRSVSRAGLSRRMRLAIEALGPTFIKLAQIISSGEG